MSAPLLPPPARRLIVAFVFASLVVYTWERGRDGTLGVHSRHSGGDKAGALVLREVARQIGIDFTHAATRVDPLVAPIEQQITATGAAVSVTDFDGDGLPDLFATTSAHGARNALFRNQGDGTFLDVSEGSGLEDLNRLGEGCGTGSVWGDYDNDGLDDVFIYKWGYGQLFRNEGHGRFRDVSEESGVRTWVNSNHANWLDYDRDGLLDLFIAGYFAEEHDLWNLSTSRIMQDSFEFSFNGGRNRLFRNRGDGTFEDVTEASGIAGARWTYASVAADFDGDGWQDLYVANDYGAEELWLNRGGRHFELAQGVGLGGESKSGMCAAIGDLWKGERLCVYVTNISKRGYLLQGNNLRVNFVDDGGGLVQIAEGPIVDAGWAWGAQFGDLDNDSHHDLVVVNGFISASRERDYWYQMSKISGAHGEVIADAAKWPEIGDRSLSGYERTRVFLNNGRPSLSFREVGVEAGIEDELDGRAVAVADLFGTGRLDIVVANQNGPLLVYRNETAGDDRHWLALHLVGTTSNRNAFGARVEIDHGQRRQLRVHTAASGFAAQNGPQVHFGLGAHAEPVDATITWPSGRVQVVEGLAADALHRIEEPR